MYDALILGGGPAGLSAAVYLGRFRRNVLVIDAGEGRSSFSQVNENYLGFPDGITTRELRELGRKQAERFGAEFADCRVESVEQIDGGYRLASDEGVYEGRTLLFATGVIDIWPDVPGIERWVGCGVHWCITCDGFHAMNKRLVCIGHDDEAATTVLQFLLYTNELTFVIDPAKDEICPDKRKELDDHEIAIVGGKVTQIEASEDGNSIQAVCLEDESRIECEMIFSLIGVTPNTTLAGELGVKLDKSRYIVMDEEGYTSLPGVFAAGDLTRMYTQQVASAVHAGAEAAQTMNYYLYDNFQKNVDDFLPAASPAHARKVGAENASIDHDDGPVNLCQV